MLNSILRSIVLLVQILSMVVIFAELFYVVAHNSSVLHIHFILMSLCLLLIVISYTMEITSDCENSAFTNVCYSYIGKPFFAIESTYFVFTYYKKKFNRFWYVLSYIVGIIIVLLVFTNREHMLFYTKMSFDSNGVFSGLIVEHGPLFFVFIAFITFFYFLSMGLAFYEVFKITKKGSGFSKDYQLSSVYISVSFIPVVLSYIISALDPLYGYDFTVLGYACSSFIYYYLIFHLKIFDTINIAKDQTIDNLSLGLRIYDNRFGLVYNNKSSDEFMNVPDINKAVNNDDLKTEKIVNIGDRYYRLKKNNIIEDDLNVGKSIEITDITLSYNYQKALKNEVEKKTEKIEHLQRMIVDSVASIIESRNMETGLHVKRTRGISYKIAEKLKENGLFQDEITPDFIDYISMAAPLHDIGKITIPDSVLLKPGRLSDEEFDIIKTHSVNGANMIEKTMNDVETPGFVKMAADIAKYHHEWWNGYGYPEHISGNDIPLAARIVALADSFDALISQRCYKKPYTLEEAIEIIKNESGTHFDPRIVDTFLTFVKEI